ncbi:MAG: hypothetical protein KGL31_08255 [candidate division NC10 bacterium]|nr:hypothetical protein [candidate division NC10 bacterium]MDE2321891.1 hypothetical protein [candidate division NC10 bacterium]
MVDLTRGPLNADIPRKNRRIDKDILAGYVEATSKTIEFETELTGGPTLSIPPEIAAALPSRGKVTIVVVMDRDPEYTTWRKAAYEQFLSDDSEEDAVYDKYR